MIKLSLKILAGVAGLIVLAVVVMIVFTDTIARTAMISSIRAQTGLEAEIGRVQVGLLRPTLRVENFVLHSSTGSGSYPMVTIPELFIEYDREAASRRELHLRLMRLHVAEVQVVEEAPDRTNLKSFPGWLSKIQVPKGPVPPGAVQFRGIDTLDLTLGKIRFNSVTHQATEVVLGVDHEIIRNVTSETNLYPLLVKIALRGGVQLLGSPSEMENSADATSVPSPAAPTPNGPAR